jgi:predicted small lipoprotein YifL
VVLRRRLLLAALLLVLLAGCGINEYGPWYTPAGDLVSNSTMVEFRGFERCGTDKVLFIRFLGKQYAKDPEGQLGTLLGPNGSTVTYAEFQSIPPGIEATGVRHQIEEIYKGSDVDDYLYVVYDGGFTERWPRAEVECTP